MHEPIARIRGFGVCVCVVARPPRHLLIFIMRWCIPPTQVTTGDSVRIETKDGATFQGIALRSTAEENRRDHRETGQDSRALARHSQTRARRQSQGKRIGRIPHARHKTKPIAEQWVIFLKSARQHISPRGDRALYLWASTAGHRPYILFYTSTRSTSSNQVLATQRPYSPFFTRGEGGLLRWVYRRVPLAFSGI